MSARRKHKEEHSEGGERWLITYADLVTLLFAVFIVLYAGSNSDEERFGRTAEGIRQAFDVGLGVLSGGGSDPGVFEEGGDAVPLPTVQGNSDAEPVLREVNALAQSHGLSGQVNVRLEEGRLIIALANDLLFDAASASIDEQAITFLSDLGGVRVDGIDESAGMVADSAGGAALHRIDHALTVGENDPVRITLVAPETLLSGLVAALAGDGASDEQGVDAAGAVDEQGTDEADEAPMFDDEELIAIDPVDLPDLDTISSMSVEGEPRPLDLLLDVSMQVSAELGRCQMTVEEILSISPGSVVELDKLAGEPVDVLINDRLIARGEVVMVDENFGVRITEILSPRTIPTAQAEPV